MKMELHHQSRNSPKNHATLNLYRYVATPRRESIDLAKNVQRSHEFGCLSQWIDRAEVNLMPELRTLGERN